MAITIRDVAQLAGASVAAVSSTLNGSRSQTIRVSQETRERIFNAAAQLGYVSNPIAKSLATGKTGVVGLMLPYAQAFVDQNPFCMTVMQGFMNKAIEHRLNVMLYTASNDGSGADAATMVDLRVDGLVLVMPEEDSPLISKLEKGNVAYVSVLRKPKLGAWTVNSDDYGGARLATKHLIDLGHRNLVHLAGGPTVMTTEPRRQGFLDQARESGVVASVVDANFDWVHGYTAAMHIFGSHSRQSPTGVFAANDLCADGVLRALRDLHIRVPEDVSVVGYDDTTQTVTTQPKLTSVHMGIDEMGSTALELLLSRLEGREVEDHQPVLPTRLTIRESCGANERLGASIAPNDP
jgi:DNA-binding LacI/PurR family transcriptional regulator